MATFSNVMNGVDGLFFTVKGDVCMNVLLGSIEDASAMVIDGRIPLPERCAAITDANTSWMFGGIENEIKYTAGKGKVTIWIENKKNTSTFANAVELLADLAAAEYISWIKGHIHDDCNH